MNMKLQVDVKNLPYSYYRIAFNEEHKILINHIGYYAGKLEISKYYDKTFKIFHDFHGWFGKLCLKLYLKVRKWF